MELKNKVAIVTGAAQGIGKSTALVLATYGSDIIVADLNLDVAQNTADDIRAMGRNAIAIKIDVSNKTSVEDGVDTAIKHFGKIDILVNAAGVSIASMVETLPEDIWDLTMNINVKGVFLCCQAVIKHMKENRSGKIINLSSRAAKIAEISLSSYCSSKAAVGMFTQVLALEMAPYNINVNAVCPGLVDTEMIQKAIIRISNERGLDPEEYRKSWVEEVPFKRMAKPEEIGELIAFLASDKSEYITGASINISGGTTMV